ncbi:MAG: glucosamine-6-phosphate deaminase [Nocardioidaceae bacterium]
MEVIVLPSPAEVAVVAADLVTRTVARKPDAVIGVATGSSPVALYDELAARVATGVLSFAGCSAFMLDEYVGLDAGHPERYRTVIDTVFASRVDIDPARVHGPDGLAADLAAACADYERLMAEAGGVDLQILGLGSDGHIAFNEPGSSLASRTRIKTLTAQTRTDNARFFGGDLAAVPRHCLTQGVGTILGARHLLVLATGEGKAEAVHQCVEGAVSAMWPASAMQLHPTVTIIVDEPAASLLQLRAYYQETYAHKPDWQRF